MRDVYQKQVFKSQRETLKEKIRSGEHALSCEDVDHYVYEMSRHRRIYEDGSITISVVDNALVLEDKYDNRIYIIYFETSEKSHETAKTIPDLIQLTNITIDKLADKLGTLKKITVENITRTFFIYQEKNPA